MKKTRLSARKVLEIPKEAELSVPKPELCRTYGADTS